MMFAQSVRWSQGTTKEEQYRLQALLARHVDLHLAAFTTFEIVRMIFYMWESTLYAVIVDTLLEQLTQRTDTPHDNAWPAHEVANIQAHCGSLSNFRTYLPVITSFRLHARKSSFVTDIRQNNDSAGQQLFNMSSTESRDAAVYKVVALVGGIKAIAIECVRREFNAVLRDLQWDGCLDRKACKVLGLADGSEALSAAYMTDRMRLQDTVIASSSEIEKGLSKRGSTGAGRKQVVSRTRTIEHKTPTTPLPPVDEESGQQKNKKQRLEGEGCKMSTQAGEAAARSLRPQQRLRPHTLVA
jgi:hypothetical protein